MEKEVQLGKDEQILEALAYVKRLSRLRIGTERKGQIEREER